MYPEAWLAPACIGIGVCGSAISTPDLCDRLRSCAAGMSDSEAKVVVFELHDKVEKSSYQVGETEGILKANWLEKRRSATPSVVVLSVSFDGLQESHLQRPLIGRNATPLLLLVSGASSADDVEGKLARMRRRSNEGKAGGGEEFSPPPFVLAKDEGGSIASHVVSTLYVRALEMGREFYKHESKRIKRKRDDLSRVTEVARYCRYHFKLGYLNEARCEFETALKYYRSAYDNLATLRLNLSASTGHKAGASAVHSFSFVEIRNCAELVYLRLSALYERMNKDELMAPFVLHFANFRTFSGASVIEEEHYAWLSRQCCEAARKMEGKEISVHKSASSLRDYTPGLLYLEAAEYLIRSRHCAQRNTGRFENERDLCSFGKYFVGQMVVERVQDSSEVGKDVHSAVIDPLTSNSYGEDSGGADSSTRVFDGRWSSRERGADAALFSFIAWHREEQKSRASIVSLLDAAERHVKKKNKKHDRLVGYIGYLKSMEFYLMEDFANALRGMERIIPFYRKESWSAVLCTVLCRSLECACVLGEMNKCVRYCFELLSPSMQLPLSAKNILNLLIYHCIWFEDEGSRSLLELAMEAVGDAEEDAELLMAGEINAHSPSLLQPNKDFSFIDKACVLEESVLLSVPSVSQGVSSSCLSVRCETQGTHVHVRDICNVTIVLRSFLPLDLPISSVRVEWSDPTLDASISSFPDASPLFIPSDDEIHLVIKVAPTLAETVEVRFITVTVGDGASSIRIRWNNEHVQCQLKVSPRLSNMKLRLFHFPPAIEGYLYPTLLLIDSGGDHVMPGGRLVLEQKGSRRPILTLSEKGMRNLESELSKVTTNLMKESSKSGKNVSRHCADISRLFLASCLNAPLSLVSNSDPTSFPEIVLQEIKAGSGVCLPLIIQVNSNPKQALVPGPKKHIEVDKKGNGLSLNMVVHYASAQKDMTRKESCYVVNIQKPFEVSYSTSIVSKYDERKKTVIRVISILVQVQNTSEHRLKVENVHCNEESSLVIFKPTSFGHGESLSFSVLNPVNAILEEDGSVVKRHLGLCICWKKDEATMADIQLNNEHNVLILLDPPLQQDVTAFIESPSHVLRFAPFEAIAYIKNNTPVVKVSDCT
mmetsp:Transcript_34264/g.88531  ORF Transcript_34264/g.88531 Transcript_34264/m.88531 type:complete len:1110 (-) Transcript_34264:1229-4558(-)